MKFNFKKITKTTLALIFASSFIFPSLAFAEESTTETSTLETVDLQEVQTELENVQTETPSVVPGDFFYFAKIAFEKIKLAFTMDDAKEAELMATYASERLAEAAVLYGEGDEAKALEIIQTAIEYMEDSQNLVDSETPASEEDEVTNDEPATNEDDEVNTEDENTTPSEDENTDEQEPANETETMIRNNIVALTAAMAHVGNENAKAQLQKNIDKTYAKIAKKLKKFEDKYGTNELDDQEIEAPTDLEPVVVPDQSVTEEAAEEVTNTDETTIVAPTVNSESTNVTIQDKAKDKQNKIKPEKIKENKQPQNKNAQNQGKKPEAKQKSNNGNGNGKN